MRLIGGKDYYDGAAPFDTDPTRTFQRHKHNEAAYGPIRLTRRFRNIPTVNVKGDGRGFRTNNRVTVDGVEYHFKEIHVIFAGKLYQGVSMEHWVPSTDIEIGHWKKQWFWSWDALVAKLDSLGLEMSGVRRYRTDLDNDGVLTNRLLTPDEFNMIRERKILVAIESNYHRDSVTQWYINTDGLHTVGFAAAVDPWTAYQELDMLLGTLMVNDDTNMVKISDKSLIAKHGFDDKSFRNTHHRGKPRGQKEPT